MKFIDQDWVEKLSEDDKFLPSHGAKDGFLGGGMLYYALAYMSRSSCSICLGSGGGFVPKIMRLAQYDLGIHCDSTTYLVDANMPEAGWGEPNYHDKETSFTKDFDVQIVRKKTEDAWPDFAVCDIGYLHIDADHSYEGVRHDFNMYSKNLRKDGFITLHDTIPRTAGVWLLVEQLRADKSWQVMNLRIGMGVAIITRSI